MVECEAKKWVSREMGKFYDKLLAHDDDREFLTYGETEGNKTMA